jgi:DNA mismatch endonuclease (patch repair protein)
VTDIVDQQTRSRMMAGIRGKDTRPELALRRAMHASGFRYGLHAKGIPGRPDLVLPRFSAVVFVHGCFWHRHDGCRYTTVPSTRAEFWQTKFAVNVVRDKYVRGSLLADGWRVATVWECALRKPDRVESTVNLLGAWLRGSAPELEIGEKEVRADKNDECVVSSRLGGWQDETPKRRKRAP